MDLSDIDTFFERLDRLLALGPQASLARPVAIRFALGDAGSYLLKASPHAAGSVAREPSKQQVDVEEVSCTLSCTLQVLLDLAGGQLKPATAFIRGLIKISGERAVFMQLRSVIQAAALELKQEAGARQSGGVSVAVLGASVHAGADDRYAVYQLQVTEHGESWLLERRWSEVRGLARAIAKLRPPGRSVSPRLPWWLDFAGSLEPSFLAQRCGVLAPYLQAVAKAWPRLSVASRTGPAPLVEFLSPDAAPPNSAPPNSAPPPAVPLASTPRAAVASGQLATRHTTHRARHGAPHAASARSARTAPARVVLRHAAVDAADGDATAAACPEPPYESSQTPPPAAPQTPGAKGGGSGVDAHTGLLLASLQAEAMSPPIGAEAAPEALAVRKGLLLRLRALEERHEAAQRRRAERAAAARHVLTVALLGAASLWVVELGAAIAASALLLVLGWVVAPPSRWPLSAAALLLVGAAYGALIMARAAEGGLVEGGLVEAAEDAAQAATAEVAEAAESMAQAAAAEMAEAAQAQVAQESAAEAAAATAAAATAEACSLPTAGTSPAAHHGTDDHGAIRGTEAAMAWAMVAQGSAAAASLVAGAVAEAISRLRAERVTVVVCLSAVVVRSFGRLAWIYAVGFGTLLAYLAANKMLGLASRCGLPEAAEEAAWSALHTLLARPVCAQLVKLRSVFVKFGQYIGGRMDVIPPEWAAELKQLQDDLPAAGISHVRRSLRADFGVTPEQLFASLDATPIASASVAQVHAGWLRGSEQRVVLKLQHRGVAKLMARDMVAAKRITAAVARYAPSFGVLQTVLGAWEAEMAKELDFELEAANLVEVAANLRAAGLEAVVPTPLPGLVSTRALVMSFEEGFKITDLEALAMHAVDCQALMARVVHIYGQQLFVDGFFNADPHAGNLMVQVRCGVALPVLLDFGMTVRLSHRQRLGYARLAHAAHQMDSAALQCAVRSLGVKNSQSDELPTRDLEFWRFFMRDTGGRAQATASAKAFFAKRGKQREEDEAAGRRARRLDEVPPDLIFFWRVIGLIRGLCATLSVRVPYLEILASRARLALAAEVPAPQRALAFAPPPPRLQAAAPLNAQLNAQLNVKLSALLRALCADGSVRGGVSVTVQRGGATLAEAVAGFRGWPEDPRPVLDTTPFPLLELSSLLAVLALHALVRRGTLRYDTPLSSIWPALATAKRGATLADALSHRLSLEPPPLDVLHSPAALSDMQARIADLTAAPPACSNGGVASRQAEPAPPRSSGLSHGWLLAGILERAAPPQTYAALMGELLAPLGLSEAIWCGQLPPRAAADAALVSTGFAAAMKRLAPPSDQSTDPSTNPSAAPSAAASPEANEPMPDAASAAPLMRDVLTNAGSVNVLHDALVPGLTGFGTSGGVARLLAEAGALAPPGAWDARCGVEVSALFGERQWALGVQAYERRGGHLPLLGMHSCGGSVALFDPQQALSIVVLLNDCQLDYGATRRVLDLISSELNLGQVSFLEQGLF